MPRASRSLDEGRPKESVDYLRQRMEAAQARLAMAERELAAEREAWDRREGRRVASPTASRGRPVRDGSGPPRGRGQCKRVLSRSGSESGPLIEELDGSEGEEEPPPSWGPPALPEACSRHGTDPAQVVRHASRAGDCPSREAAPDAAAPAASAPSDAGSLAVLLSSLKNCGGRSSDLVGCLRTLLETCDQKPPQASAGPQSSPPGAGAAGPRQGSAEGGAPAREGAVGHGVQDAVPPRAAQLSRRPSQRSVAASSGGSAPQGFASGPGASPQYRGHSASAAGGSRPRSNEAEVEAAPLTPSPPRERARKRPRAGAAPRATAMEPDEEDGNSQFWGAHPGAGQREGPALQRRPSGPSEPGGGGQAHGTRASREEVARREAAEAREELARQEAAEAREETERLRSQLALVPCEGPLRPPRRSSAVQAAAVAAAPEPQAPRQRSASRASSEPMPPPGAEPEGGSAWDDAEESEVEDAARPAGRAIPEQHGRDEAWRQVMHMVAKAREENAKESGQRGRPSGAHVLMQGASVAGSGAEARDREPEFEEMPSPDPPAGAAAASTQASGPAQPPHGAMRRRAGGRRSSAAMGGNDEVGEVLPRAEDHHSRPPRGPPAEAPPVAAAAPPLPPAGKRRRSDTGEWPTAQGPQQGMAAAPPLPLAPPPSPDSSRRSPAAGPAARRGRQSEHGTGGEEPCGGNAGLEALLSSLGAKGKTPQEVEGFLRSALQAFGSQAANSQPGQRRRHRSSERHSVASAAGSSGGGGSRAHGSSGDGAARRVGDVDVWPHEGGTVKTDGEVEATTPLTPSPPERAHKRARDDTAEQMAAPSKLEEDANKRSSEAYPGAGQRRPPPQRQPESEPSTGQGAGHAAGPRVSREEPARRRRAEGREEAAGLRSQSGHAREVARGMSLPPAPYEDAPGQMQAPPRAHSRPVSAPSAVAAAPPPVTGRGRGRAEEARYPAQRAEAVRQRSLSQASPPPRRQRRGERGGGSGGWAEEPAGSEESEVEERRARPPQAAEVQGSMGGDGVRMIPQFPCRLCEEERAARLHGEAASAGREAPAMAKGARCRHAARPAVQADGSAPRPQRSPSDGHLPSNSAGSDEEVGEVLRRAEEDIFLRHQRPGGAARPSSQRGGAARELRSGSRSGDVPRYGGGPEMEAQGRPREQRAPEQRAPERRTRVRTPTGDASGGHEQQRARQQEQCHQQ
eukprot:CAMPEP_0175537182 /NCGR_PEP_ID=MMETSP0096-20121207/25085_1 /TAXON_ID=311494 /ORGANISM="Alexandrium monilatum, Strain CCMP3105" /LENGTH=1199 /DNA_ID=CAMNT_0016840007 /DNA_START=16 /DNA_END=3615 /DNA_ORIENTATION=+